MKITLLAFGFLFSLIKSENWCGFTKMAKCEDDETCCRGPTGWKCHKIKDAICCDDNLTACPQNKKCDNIKHICVV